MALRDVDYILSATPDNLDGLLNKCRIYDEQRNFDLAIYWCSEAITYHPDSAIAFNNRGWAYFRAGKHRAAAEDFRTALSMEADYKTALHNLTRTLDELGDLAYASEQFEDMTKKIDNEEIKTEYIRYLVRNKYKLANAATITKQLVSNDVDKSRHYLLLQAQVWATIGNVPELNNVVSKIREDDPELFSLLRSSNVNTENRAVNNNNIQEAFPSIKGFRSDTDRAACYLELLQNQNLMKTRSTAREQIQRLSGSAARLVRDALGSVPSSRYEDPVAYAILKTWVDYAFYAAKKQEIRAPKLPVLFGTTDISGVNAEVTTIPDDFVCLGNRNMLSAYYPQIILVNSRFFYFVHDMTKALLAYLPQQKTGATISVDVSAPASDYSYDPPETEEAFTAAMMDFLQVGTAIPLAPPPDVRLDSLSNVRLITEIEDGMEAFIVGHEVAHILLGHTMPPPTVVSTDDYKSSWDRELAADRLGLQLAEAMINRKEAHTGKWGGHFPSISYLSPILYFDLLEVFELAERLSSKDVSISEASLIIRNRLDEIARLGVRHQSQSSLLCTTHACSTHPPAAIRRNQVVQILMSEGKLGQASTEPAEALMSRLMRGVYQFFSWSYVLFADVPSLSLVLEKVDESGAGTR